MPRESSPGFQRHVIPVRVSGAGLSGAGQVVLVDSLALGFRYWLEKVVWLTLDTLVGAGGTQTFNIRKGGAAGTVLGVLTPTVASQAAIGSALSDAITAAEEDTARFLDADTITIERAAGGTTITAGAGEILLIVRQKDQGRR